MLAAGLKLGTLDFEDLSVTEVLAVRATAESIVPFGAPFAQYQPLVAGVVADQSASDIDVQAMLIREIAGGSTVDQSYVNPNGVVSVCSTTINVVKMGTTGWLPSTHRFHHDGVRTAVHAVLLTADRLRRQPNEALAHMPIELWLLILGFCRRRFWSVSGTDLTAVSVVQADHDIPVD